MKISRRTIKPGGLPCWGFLLWLGFTAVVAPVTAQLQPTVISLTISNVGPQTVGDSLVRANMRVKQGDPYTRNVIDDDIRNLYSTGLFLNVQVLEDRSSEGIALIYLVQPRLKITDIFFTGNKKFRDKKLRKKISTEVGDPLDERKLFMDAQEIKTLYEKRGYPKTKVDFPIVPDERTGRATVTFEIIESKKVKIDDVIFDGAEAYSQRKLRRKIKTRRRWWLSWLTQSGILKDEQLEDDKEKLAEFYRNEGYIDFDLKEVREVPKGERKVILRFVVSEGQQYRVGAVDFNGITLFTTNQANSRLKMGVGETFTPKDLSEDLEAVRDLYGEKGYIDARINPRKNPNTDTGTMDLVYEVEENDKSYIEKIEIRGNTKTKDRVIRRELAVSPGEVFDMVRVKRSAERLRNLNYFEDQFGVDTQPEQTDVPNRRNLVVTVREKNTGNVQVGAGFSSIDSLLGFVEITQGNFDLFNPFSFQGGGQKARLRMQLGTERQDFLVDFIEPWFLERKLELSVALYHRELNFLSENDTYDETTTGMRLGLRKALGSEFLIGGVSYTLENVDISLNDNLHGPETRVINNGLPIVVTNVPANVSEEIASEAVERLVSKGGTSISYDTRHGFILPLLPTKGQKTELSGELAGGPFGGDSDFYKIELRHAHYVPGFFEGHLLELGARTGVAESYGDTDVVPLFDRYFLGGLDSLRGYSFRRIGPRDEFGEPLGGDTFWFGTAEYSVPIVERVRAAVFYDIGMVYRDSYHWNFSEYADNWGLGVRLLLPIGPLRLDYGIPIHNSTGRAGSGKFQFSAGYTRDF